MKNIITIQHTQSQQHTNCMIGSWSDWDLTELGKIQANKIGQRLSKEIREDYVLYSSDIRRATKTAEIVSSYFNVVPVYDSRLREFHLGQAIGNSKAWAKNNLQCDVWPGTIDWGQSIDDQPFVGAESKRDVWLRLSNFMDDIMTNEHENIIIISHDGSLSILYALWLGLDLAALNTCHLSGKTGGISFLREDSHGHRIIERLNDMSYID